MAEKEPMSDLQTMAQAFAAAMAANNKTLADSIAAIAPKPEIVEGSPEYRARQESEGWFDSFERPVYQNGYEAEARGLSEEVRHRASNLKEGMYIKTPKNPRGRVQVIADNSVVRILYPVSGDNMSNNRDYWSSFPDLINKIWAEMEAKELVKA